MIGLPLRSTDIRERNEKLVLRLIHSRRGISQSEVAQITGLKPPTVFRIFSNLEKEHFIRPLDQRRDADERKGRRPVYYGVNQDIAYAVGIDFWSRSAAVAIVDFAGSAVHTAMDDFPAGMRASSLIDRLDASIHSALAASAIDPAKVLGVGIGAPGRVDTDSGRVLHYSRIRGMHGFPVAELLGERLGYPTYVHNNCSVIALSEYRYGEAAGARSLLTLLIRSGVGGAFLQDGRIFTSGSRTTLEAGHMTVHVGGLPCECGLAGCLEAYVSEEAIQSASSVRSIEELGKAVECRCQETLAGLSRAAEYLTVGVRSLIHVLSPDTVLLVSRSKPVADYLIRRTEEALAAEDRSYDPGEVRFLSAEYDPILAGRSAADLVFDRFLST